MNKAHRFHTVAGAGVALVMTGCSSVAPGHDVKAPSADGVDDAKYAVYLSPQSVDLGEGTGGQSRVILVNKDGTYKAVATQGMDLGQIVWSDDGIFFSDMDNDYSLDASGVKTVPSPKTDNQVGVFALDNKTTVGLYNEGFTDDGYSTQVVTSDGKKAVKRGVEGNYFITAKCGKDIYGVSRATGRYSKTDDPETEPMMLAQLTGTANGKEQVLGSSETAKEGAVVPDAPCVAGTMYYISNSGSTALGKTPKPVLSSWNTKTGQYNQIPLENATGKKSLMRDDGTGLPQVGSQSVRGNAIEWYGAGNTVLSTELKTGKTTRKFDVEGHTNDSASSKAVFTPTEVALLVENNGGTDFRVVAYDRNTGKETSRTTIKGLVNDIPHTLILRGFAVRP